MSRAGGGCLGHGGVGMSRGERCVMRREKEPMEGREGDPEEGYLNGKEGLS